MSLSSVRDGWDPVVIIDGLFCVLTLTDMQYFTILKSKVWNINIFYIEKDKKDYILQFSC